MHAGRESDARDGACSAPSLRMHSTMSGPNRQAGEEEFELPPQLKAILIAVEALREDLAQAAVMDIVVRADVGSAILTLDREFLEPRDVELLRGANATALGKVTALFEKPVSLLSRRSAALESLGREERGGV